MPIHLPAPEHEFHYTRRDFQQVRERLYQHAGISLSENKQQLVYSRLSRRLRSLRLGSFAEYFAYLESHEEEWQQFVNALTTNLTAFFREPHHFELLLARAQQHARKRGAPLRCWSSACCRSRGASRAATGARRSRSTTSCRSRRWG